MSDSDRSGPDEDELEHVPFPKMADTTAEWTIPRKYAKLFGANAPAKSSGGAGFGRLAFDSVPVLAAAAYASVHGNDMMSFSRLVSRGPPVSI